MSAAGWIAAIGLSWAGVMALYKHRRQSKLPAVSDAAFVSRLRAVRDLAVSDDWILTERDEMASLLGIDKRRIDPGMRIKEAHASLNPKLSFDVGFSHLVDETTERLHGTGTDARFLLEDSTTIADYLAVLARGRLPEQRSAID